jgi:UDP-N-acetylglucosamine--N-acetylmuramyl-(pentapeptide) pyrophosphoryl-undecaprenol N-acetylglucosamine transferase
MPSDAGPFTFAMAGGGTGGHVIPSIAVARELKQIGHEVFFIGTHSGMEAKLVPAAGFALDWIDISGLKRVGWRQTISTIVKLPASIWAARRSLRFRHAAAVFSMGGYVAAPVMAAARMLGLPMTIMEPNAIPGVTNRRLGRMARKVLLTFEEAAQYFSASSVEVTGLPVRQEFFEIPDKPPSERLTVLVTGGSQGSRTLNQACEQAWPALRQSKIRMIHQTGATHYEGIAARFKDAGVDGEVTPFIADMPQTFSSVDVVVCRSGAGAVSELAAAGKPSILVPFPYAADDHQTKNAQALERLGATRFVRDLEMSGDRLIVELESLTPAILKSMSAAARSFAKPAAARRAAELLIELAGAR